MTPPSAHIQKALTLAVPITLTPPGLDPIEVDAQTEVQAIYIGNISCGLGLQTSRRIWLNPLNLVEAQINPNLLQIAVESRGPRHATGWIALTRDLILKLQANPNHDDWQYWRIWGGAVAVMDATHIAANNEE